VDKYVALKVIRVVRVGAKASRKTSCGMSSGAVAKRPNWITLPL
jgi:hypothetical protein